MSSSPTNTKKKWLLRYVLSLAVLAFLGRALPLSFLSLALQTKFHQSTFVTGIVMSSYSLAALIATPAASRIARSTRRIVILHSASLVMIAGALGLCAAADWVQRLFGDNAGALWLAFCRALQGVGASFYLSSNTSLLARKFPEQLSYAIALIEVCVGTGGQVGRIVGGFLYDLGGLPLPFLLVASLQAAFAFVGFTFDDDAPVARSVEAGIQKQVSDGAQKPSAIPWKHLLTPRLCVGASAAFVVFFGNGFMEATLLPYMSDQLAPVTVGDLGVGTSWRAMSYLITTFLMAPLMHRELISCELLILTGCVFVMIGVLLHAPQPFVTEVVIWLTGSEPSRFSQWIMFLTAFGTMSIGNGLLFVPSLPLMQHEVRRHGQMAVEQVAELFVIMMTLGEMIGPIAGGWLVQESGFAFGTFMLAFLSVPTFITGMLSYDGAAIRARRLAADLDATPRPLDEEVENGEVDTKLSCGSCAPRRTVAADLDANFALRRLPFAIDVKYNDGFVDVPNSAPADTFRRSFAPSGEPLLDADQRRVAKTAPSETFRRQYAAPAARTEKGGSPKT